MKIECELDAFEAEALFDLIHEDTTKHREEARLKFACGEITQERLNWHLGHADFICGIGNKICGSRFWRRS